MSQSKSVSEPLDRTLSPAAADVVRKAHALGLVEENTSFDELTYPVVRQVVLQVREAGLAVRAATDFVHANPFSVATLARDLREIDALLEDSPLPSTEWPRLTTVFDRDQLARLLGIGPVSVHRYARGERQTPDEVAARLHVLALVVGDLAGAYNEIGIRRWFDRKRSALAGRAPAAYLTGAWRPEDPGPRRVRELARALVAGSAT